MQDRFSAKVNDFVNWCENAIAHYEKGYYADALTNMRKSGEAACKLMFYYRFPDKVAMEKTEGKSYKELIQAVIWHDIADRRVINWLEAMQIHGNDAAHDIPIEKDQAEFAVNALRLFIDWMFTHYIKASVPSRLKKAIASLSHPVKADELTSQIQKELDKIKKEKVDLEKLLTSLSEKNTGDTEKVNQLTSELQKSISNLKELEQEKTKIKEEPILVSKELPIEKKKTFPRRKLIYTGAGTIALALILFFTFKKWNSSSANQNKNETVQQTAVDSFHVLMLPLSIMQDNPNMTLKFEDAVQNRIQQRIKEKNVPISISFDRSFIKGPVSFDEAVEQGTKHRVNVVLFGELYEPQSTSDSTQINMKFVMTRKQDRVTEEMGVLSFLRLSDSASIKIQMGAACFVDLSYADFLMGKGKFSQALSVLYDAKPISKSQKINIADFLATCHSSKKNFPAAIKEIEKLIELEPKEDYSYASMANVLCNMGDYKKAEENYKKALFIKPNNINTILNYANMLAMKDVNRLAQSKELLLQAIKFDSTVSTAWRYLGDLENMNTDFENAVKHYRKALSLDSSEIVAKRCMAQILAFNFKQPEEGEKILSSILRKDSTDATALFILANIYTSTKLANPDKAEYLIAKSKKYQTFDNDYSNKFAEGLAAMQKFGYERAVKLLTAAYNKDSSDMSLTNSIASCYINLKNYDKAYYYISHAWNQDSMDYMNNANMGYFYMYSDKKYFDLKKAAHYFEKSLKTNPYDTISLENLAIVYWNFGDRKKTKEILLRLYAILPDNFTANHGLGAIYEQESNFKKALVHYKKAISVRPNDDDSNYNYALCLMKISTNNYSEAVRYAQRAYELNPNGADNIYILAQMYVVSKDYMKAKEYYEKALAIKSAIKDPVFETELDKLLKEH